MTWSVTQKVSGVSAAETVMDVASQGGDFYSCIRAWNTASSRWIAVTEKRVLTTGALTWQRGVVEPNHIIPLCVATDGVNVYHGDQYGTGIPIGRIAALNATTGVPVWSFQEFHPMCIYYYNGIAADGVGVYGGGTYKFNGEYCIQALTLAGALNWEQKVWPGVAADGNEAFDVATYGGDVYSCGFLSYAVGDDRPYVERRGNVAGALVWGIEEAGAAYIRYYNLSVDSTGVYVLSYPDSATQLYLRLKSLALADGSEQWAVNIDSPLTMPGMGAMSQYGTDVTVLGNKVYVSYRYFDPFDPIIPGDINVVESRDKATGAFIARDRTSSTTTFILWEGFTGISNAPAADDIIIGGSINPTGADASCYWEDFLAALPAPSGPTMDQIMRGCKWFNSGSFQGMYLGWR